MSSKNKQHDKAFKEEAIRYAKTRPELTQEECAGNFELGPSTRSRWKKNLESGVPYWGNGNYASEETREIARLKRELRNSQNALDVLKKAISILEKNDSGYFHGGPGQGGNRQSSKTLGLCLWNAENIGASRSGCRAFLKCCPSRWELRKNRLKQRIMQIYHSSTRITGRPKSPKPYARRGSRFRARGRSIHEGDGKLLLAPNCARRALRFDQNSHCFGSCAMQRCALRKLRLAFSAKMSYPSSAGFLGGGQSENPDLKQY